MSKALMLDTKMDKDRRVFHQRGSVVTRRCCQERLHQSRRSDTFGFSLMKKPTFVSTIELNIRGLRAKARPHSEDALFLNCPLKDAFWTE